MRALTFDTDTAARLKQHAAARANEKGTAVQYELESVWLHCIVAVHEWLEEHVVRGGSHG